MRVRRNALALCTLFAAALTWQFGSARADECCDKAAGEKKCCAKADSQVNACAEECEAKACAKAEGESKLTVTAVSETKTAENPEAVFKMLEEAARPGPEHKRLEALAGEWKYSCKFWLDPNQPAIESSGTIKRQWILGNRFLEEHVSGKGPDGKDFDGCAVIGYDNVQKKYTYGWVSTMGTGISTGVGTYDADNKQFTFKTEGYCPLRQGKAEGREEIRIESNDKHVLTMYQLLGDKEVKMMELTAERTRDTRSAERETSPIR